MSKQRSVKGKPCIFCGEPGSPAGEHVIPAWLNRWMDRQWGGPYPVHRNGEPHLNRDGEVWTTEKPVTYKAPCCEHHNGILRERFEAHQGEVESFLEGWTYDAVAVGLWWLKTLLLFVHPQTVETASTAEMIHYAWLSEDVDLYCWMVDGSDPPDWLHVFCALPREYDGERTERDVMSSIWLRSWELDGAKHRPDMRALGIANVQFQLIYAPGLRIEHPSPVAHELWPEPDSQFVNKGSLTPAQDFDWVNAYFVSGHYLLRSNEDDESPLEEPLRLPVANTPAWCADLRVKGATA